MSSCTRYAYERSGKCGVWYPKKYTGTYKEPKQSYRNIKGVH